MEIIFENKSLLFLINSINSELIVNVEDIETLEIRNKKYPDIFIKIFEVDIFDSILKMKQKSKLWKQRKITHINADFTELCVFAIVNNESEESNTVIVIGFLELILNKLNLTEILSDNQLKEEYSESDDIDIVSEIKQKYMESTIWDLNKEEWDLINDI